MHAGSGHGPQAGTQFLGLARGVMVFVRQNKNTEQRGHGAMSGGLGKASRPPHQSRVVIRTAKLERRTNERKLISTKQQQRS